MIIIVGLSSLTLFLSMEDWEMTGGIYSEPNLVLAIFMSKCSDHENSSSLFIQISYGVNNMKIKSIIMQNGQWQAEAIVLKLLQNGQREAEGIIVKMLHKGHAQTCNTDKCLYCKGYCPCCNTV